MHMLTLRTYILLNFLTAQNTVYLMFESISTKDIMDNISSTFSRILHINLGKLGWINSSTDSAVGFATSETSGADEARSFGTGITRII